MLVFSIAHKLLVVVLVQQQRDMEQPRHPQRSTRPGGGKELVDVS